MTIGVLLINLGTPTAAEPKAVRKYLRQFLFDPRVIELPTLLRWALVNLLIVPMRSKKSAHAYASIWQAEGSPLLINTQRLAIALQNALGTGYAVTIGMRYGQPSIKHAIKKLYATGISKLLVVPLFPQYCSATNGSALEQSLKIIARAKEIVPSIFIRDFDEEFAYVQALATTVRPFLATQHDFILMSYHGLPERQLINPGISCYKTKCMRNAAQIADQLQLPLNKWAVSFQSRLGKLPWIKPYTDQMLIDLRAKGVKNLLVVCPSFIVDCLETLEEIGIRAKQQWLDLGGTSLQLIPCLNAQPHWVASLESIVKKNVACG
ncbi:MAG TPA: ferrochelatase [Gammaproteobacteria bacterium]|nr:ferrochelatase [Gammaproteobacteria bacterium]